MALVTDAAAAPPNVTNSIQSCECCCPAPELRPAPSPVQAACSPRYHAHHGKSQAERSQNGEKKGLEGGGHNVEISNAN